MGKKIFILVLVIVLAAAIAIGGIYVKDTFFSEDVIVLPSPTPNPDEDKPGLLDEVIEQVQTVTMEEVQQILEPANELITAKYYYTEASTYENHKNLFDKYKIPFTTDEAVFTYDGVISMGIDLSKVEININNDKMKISVLLPSLEETHHEIDHNSFEVPYEKDSPFTKTSMKDYTNLIDALKKEKSEEVMGNKNFINFAKDNTIKVLEAFLTAASATADYEINITWK